MLNKVKAKVRESAEEAVKSHFTENRSVYIALGVGIAVGYLLASRGRPVQVNTISTQPKVLMVYDGPNVRGF